MRSSYFLILGTITFFFITCSTGMYQDWYADEGQEEDMLATMFGDGSESESSSASTEEDRWDSWYNDSAGDPTSGDRWANWYGESKPTAGTMEKANQVGKIQTELGQYSPEFKLTVIKEIRIPESNQLKLILQSSARLPKIENMPWKRMTNATLDEIHGPFELVNDKASVKRDDGLFEILLKPAAADDYFAFVPLEAAGITAPGFSPTPDALDVKTITITATAATNQSFSCQQAVQTYNIQTVAKALAAKVISPNIRRIELHIRDEVSQFPISDALVTVTGTAPSPLKLLSPYIQNSDLLLHASQIAPDYIWKTAQFHSTLNGLVLRCYAQNVYTLEISHPDYYFSRSTLAVDEKTESATIQLVRRPEKVRILSDARQAALY